MPEYPHLLHTVVDAPHVRELAEFYRQLLGLDYRPGDEPPHDDACDDADWLVLMDSRDRRVLAFQLVEKLARTTWPSPDVPMQMHLDFTVDSLEQLQYQHRRAVSLGADLIFDRSDDADEALLVYADPAGHPFCIFVG